MTVAIITVLFFAVLILHPLFINHRNRERKVSLYRNASISVLKEDKRNEFSHLPEKHILRQDIRVGKKLKRRVRPYMKSDDIENLVNTIAKLYNIRIDEAITVPASLKKDDSGCFVLRKGGCRFNRDAYVFKHLVYLTHHILFNEGDLDFSDVREIEPNKAYRITAFIIGLTGAETGDVLGYDFYFKYCEIKKYLKRWWD